MVKVGTNRSYSDIAVGFWIWTEASYGCSGAIGDDKKVPVHIDGCSFLPYAFCAEGIVFETAREGKSL